MPLTLVTASFALYSPGYFSGSTIPGEENLANLTTASYNGIPFLQPGGGVFLTMSNVEDSYVQVFAQRLRGYYVNSTGSEYSVVSINYMDTIQTVYGPDLVQVSQSYLY